MSTKSSYPVYASARNIDMLSKEGFLPSKREGLLWHTVDHEMKFEPKDKN